MNIKLLLSSLLFIGTAATFQLQAQSAKPADVLLSVESVKAELNQLYKASLSTPPALKSITLPAKRPRHVYQKAREVFLKIQILRRLNGLQANNLPTTPTQEVTPGDVRNLVDSSRRGLKEIIPLYWVNDSIQEPLKKNSATPTDVYRGLHEVSQLLDGLNIPPVVPNDVYRVALLIQSDMQKLYAARTGKSFDTSGFQTNTSGKTPKDVYEAEYAFLEALKQFSETAENAQIPAGISLPPRETQAINPGKVLELGNSILAEISSLKTVSNAEMQSELPAPPAGKNPSNVYDTITNASLILQALK